MSSRKNLKSEIESLLFISNRPLRKKELVNFFKVNKEEINEEIKNLISQYNIASSGIRIIDNGDEIEMITGPENAGVVKDFLKVEIEKELTPAGLETLSIIAYRGPISAEELSELRGINCAIILRHLLIKGLIVEKEEEGKFLYQVSLDFIRHLGINNLEELPNWQKLNRNVSLSELREREDEQFVSPA
ncbi:SMC-Scp complex subunit ScpB [bacterium (Candidatus Moisslbacteria) CG12_big_fil_rev_8_21_14_0_65_36_11]|nr:SMC-Scp complex subunit ScpB [Candidatus Kuenenbacteria bacterium]OIP77170.1 MAG: SMC-Scp complex subunit ScpB [Parcubacteria group bacterium CG2_30_36_38]PIV46253.1 MAG: SMC-Scp complex subunit ScpB [bacterium (Candidatus Moisslbacteria) CG02_land_8_20_14_3_00_36_53]PIW67848.1 MAG: SMC-Scp complex subunit ScpB [bacterium (Candidatus Moisslbacteria) CG12_big_fil_rev_8_21_14_0_65_36_11]PIZ90301.1 MAG: SMC-Scp complex subunit ScpB [bacterium (Candidatus Moisslbacteria) CG_4_10_14_0_2_um_filter